MDKTTRIEELIETIVPYVIATLRMATNDTSYSGWGHVHRGRAKSSIGQLEELLNAVQTESVQTERGGQYDG